MVRADLHAVVVAVEPVQAAIRVLAGRAVMVSSACTLGKDTIHEVRYH